MALFNKKIGKRKNRVGLEGIVNGLRHQLSMSPLDSGLGKVSFGVESITESQVQNLNSALEELSSTIQRVTNDAVGPNAEFTEAQMEAAQSAGVISSAPAEYLAQPLQMPTASAGTGVVGIESIHDGFSKRTIATEAYDESANRNVTVYSIAYNLNASRQDEFGETLFPTINVTPDNVGFSINTRLIQVFNDFKRSISGDLDNYNKINIVRGFTDATVLKNEGTFIIPVHRAESAKYFVANADVAAGPVLLEGESINTAPLAFGKNFSLIALSQTDALLANGVMGPEDSIEPGGLGLRSVYVKVGNNVLRFSTRNLNLANFVAAPQGLHRLHQLNFTTDSFLINKDKKRYNGAALDGALAGVVTEDYIVRVRLIVTGTINVETGDTQLIAGGLKVVSVKDEDGIALDFTTAGDPKTVADAIEAGSAIGYELDAYRANVDRRQRGQLIDTAFFNQIYTIPFRAPITALRPVNADTGTEAADLASLISATQIRTSNAAVGKVLEAAGTLKGYIDTREGGNGPDVLGVGRFIVKPTYLEEPLDMTAINSLTSADRAANVQALIVNKIRDLAFRLWRDSEYQAAANLMKGGQAKTPTVIIGTDQILARYIQIDGDLRTAGANFDVKVVSTMDSRMHGRIVVTFGDFDNISEPNPLHFGNMGWKPELTLNLPIARSGQISKELTVQPAFLHVVNLPVMGLIEVSNLVDVVASKVAITADIV